MTYKITTDKSWQQTNDELADTFAKWGVGPRAWRVLAIRAPFRPSGFYPVHERRVTIEFLHPTSKKMITITKDDQARPEDNLRLIYIGLERLRMIEKAGLSDIVREALLQIDAPTGPQARPKRSPYEIMEISPSASMTIVEAAYRAKAKELHPDRGGDADSMRELNEAFEAVKAERGAAARA